MIKMVNILCFVTLCCCFLFGCADKHNQNIEVIISDPNTISPCFNQNWDCGKWTPVKENISDIRFYMWKTEERLFGCQICEICLSTRIVDMKTNQEKLFPSPEYQQSGCAKHTWVAGISDEVVQTEELRSGDAIVVYFNKKVYFLWIDNILSNGITDYKYAELSPNAYIKSISKIQWDKLSWQKRQNKNCFLCDKDLQVSFASYLNQSSQQVLGVKYCYKTPAKYVIFDGGRSG
jgi:hypothetical protein